jgi:hypothetical protein
MNIHYHCRSLRDHQTEMDTKINISALTMAQEWPQWKSIHDPCSKTGMDGSISCMWFWHDGPSQCPKPVTIMYAPIFSLLSPQTHGCVALYYTCYLDSCPYPCLMDLRLRCLVLYLALWLDLVSLLGYLCFTYRLWTGPKPSFPFVYKLIDYHVVLYFNLTWFYLKPSRFS